MMNLWCYAEVVKCLTGNMGAKWEVKLHFCLLSGKTSQANVWFIAWSSPNSLKNISLDFDIFALS